MLTSTKSLPPSLQQLVRKLGKNPRTVNFGSTSAAYVVLNTANFNLSKTATEAMTTVDPDSRGSYQGDDGESWYETFTEFHGPVATLRGNDRIDVLVPNAPAGMSDEAFLAVLNTQEGVQMATEPTSKAPKGANPAVLVALDGFVEHVAKLVKTAITSSQTSVEIEYGKKFAKLVKLWGGQRSVHCFVDLANGDVLKAASFKAPAKHARGNILGNNVSKYGVSWTGANYIR